MPMTDPLVRLRDMLGHAREALEIAAGKSREGLASDRVLTLALTHLVEIIGEAARQVPEEMRARHPGVPWRQIVGMRNRLIHGYSSVDLNLLFDTVTEDLPALIEALEGIIQSEEQT
jgi:uncharacterized protein with HEPN domain